MPLPRGMTRKDQGLSDCFSCVLVSDRLESCAIGFASEHGDCSAIAAARYFRAVKLLPRPIRTISVLSPVAERSTGDNNVCADLLSTTATKVCSHVRRHIVLLLRSWTSKLPGRSPPQARPLESDLRISQDGSAADHC